MFPFENVVWGRRQCHKYTWIWVTVFKTMLNKTLFYHCIIKWSVILRAQNFYKCIIGIRIFRSPFFLNIITPQNIFKQGSPQKKFLTVEQTRKWNTKSMFQTYEDWKTSCIWVGTILEISLYRHFFKCNDGAWNFFKTTECHLIMEHAIYQWSSSILKPLWEIPAFQFSRVQSVTSTSQK